ncbi:hypothetical protein KC19_VG170600 [Ceratodon purpureus]|uniref:Glutaredoxin domain-containing protein n=1 Tax=Ceratodon purpureus TaxID=3225 RepID=A0A8T0HRF1_CERPU|nr:hypothetical protein KC19_VG170600 [Ceratodon purpureus]
MGCTVSKDALETNRRFRSAQTGRNMSMPVQAQNSSDNGYHTVALTSSTYGILKSDNPKINVNSVSLSNSSHDTFYEKLEYLDVSDEMLAKPWSEVSCSIPKIPLPTRTDSRRRADSLRRTDSPRQNIGSFRGSGSPRQRGSFRRTYSPCRLPSQITKNDHETINTWELMDGLDEVDNNLAERKLKPVERIPGSTVIKPFERSVTFSTIHTLSELESGDPSKAIVPGPAGDSLRNSYTEDSVGKENTNPVKVLSSSASLPSTLPNRDESTVRLTQSSPSPATTVPDSSNDPPRPEQPTVAPMTLTSEANVALQKVSNAVSKSLLRPPSLSLRSVGIKKSSESALPRQPTVAALIVAPGLCTDTLKEESKSVSKFLLPPPAPLLRSVGTKNASLIHVRNWPPGSQNYTSPMMKAVDSPMSLNTKLETSLEPDSGRVRAVATSFAEGVVARPLPTPRRVEVGEISNQNDRRVPRFASPIHVLSLAASFDLENRKNSMSHLDPKAPPGQSARKSFSQSMPSSSLKAILSSGQGVGLQSQASASIHGRPGSPGTLNVSVGSQKDSLLPDSDILASFEEAFEMLSIVERQNVRDIKGVTTYISGAVDSNRPSPTNTNGMAFDGSEEGASGDKGRQGNGNKGANAHLAGQGQGILSTLSATSGAAPRNTPEPDPWDRFELMCPPAGGYRVVLYTTSLRGIRKTFDDCNSARLIFESFNIGIDERDISIHAEFRRELKELTEKSVPVPQAFIKGRYIGGLHVITQLHEDGTLATLVDDLPPKLSRGECDGCGAVRFVPCSDCSGSTKVVTEAKEVVRCSECNENGLMRCPICY